MTDTKYVMVPVVPTDEMIIAAAGRTKPRHIYSMMIAAAPEQPPGPLDREAIRNGLLGEVIEWLETEVSAIDTWYRGDPSYEHDAEYMKDRVLHLLTEAKTAFEVEKPAQPSDSQPLHPGCARSHPHEDMNAECEALTIKARSDNESAQTHRMPSDAEILEWIFSHTKTDKWKTPRQAIAAAMREDQSPTQPSDSQAEPSDEEKDAARYRWIRDGGFYSLPYKDHGMGPEFNLSDEVVDAAMRQDQS